jgi:hypothetical protein
MFLSRFLKEYNIKIRIYYYYKSIYDIEYIPISARKQPKRYHAQENEDEEKKD